MTFLVMWILGAMWALPRSALFWLELLAYFIFGVGFAFAALQEIKSWRRNHKSISTAKSEPKLLQLPSKGKIGKTASLLAIGIIMGWNAHVVKIHAAYAQQLEAWKIHNADYQKHYQAWKARQPKGEVNESRIPFASERPTASTSRNPATASAIETPGAW